MRAPGLSWSGKGRLLPTRSGTAAPRVSLSLFFRSVLHVTFGKFFAWQDPVATGCPSRLAFNPHAGQTVLRSAFSGQANPADSVLALLSSVTQATNHSSRYLRDTPSRCLLDSRGRHSRSATAVPVTRVRGKLETAASHTCLLSVGTGLPAQPMPPLLVRVSTFRLHAQDAMPGDLRVHNFPRASRRTPPGDLASGAKVPTIVPHTHSLAFLPLPARASYGHFPLLRKRRGQRVQPQPRFAPYSPACLLPHRSGRLMQRLSQAPSYTPGSIGPLSVTTLILLRPRLGLACHAWSSPSAHNLPRASRRRRSPPGGQETRRTIHRHSVAFLPSFAPV